MVLHASAEVSVLLQGITRIDRLSAAPLRTLTISGKLKPVSHSADCNAVHSMPEIVCVCQPLLEFLLSIKQHVPLHGQYS